MHAECADYRVSPDLTFHTVEVRKHTSIGKMRISYGGPKTDLRMFAEVGLADKWRRPLASRFVREGMIPMARAW
jgi:hypothetical protein